MAPRPRTNLDVDGWADPPSTRTRTRNAHRPARDPADRLGSLGSPGLLPAAAAPGDTHPSSSSSSSPSSSNDSTTDHDPAHTRTRTSLSRGPMAQPDPTPNRPAATGGARPGSWTTRLALSLLGGLCFLVALNVDSPPLRSSSPQPDVSNEMWTWPTQPPVITRPELLNVAVHGLGGERLRIDHVPFPVRRLLNLASAYNEALRAAMFIGGVSAPGIRLALDHPGLELQGPHRHLDGGTYQVLTKPQSAAIANVTVVLQLAGEVWPQVVKAAEGLVNATLGAAHAERSSLVQGLTVPDAAMLRPLREAGLLWRDILARAGSATTSTYTLLDSLATSLMRADEMRPGADAETAVLGSPTLSPSQLELAANNMSEAGDPRALVQTLSRLALSYDARVLVRHINQSLAHFPSVDHDALCQQPDLLNAVAEGDCFFASWIRIRPEASSIPLLRTHAALCEVEHARYISARRVQRTTARLAALVAKDAALRARNKDCFWRAVVKDWRAILEKATYHAGLVDSSLRLQHLVVADVATRFQQACRLRESFRADLLPLYTRQATWWNATVTGGRKPSVVLACLTLPALADFTAELRNFSAALKAQTDLDDFYKQKADVGGAVLGARTGPGAGWMDGQGFGKKTMDDMVRRVADLESVERDG